MKKEVNRGIGVMVQRHGSKKSRWYHKECYESVY